MQQVDVMWRTYNVTNWFKNTEQVHCRVFGPVSIGTRSATRSSATAEKQRVSCAHTPRLASWPVDDHAFTLGGSMYSIRQNRRGCIIFWHSNALIHEMPAENGIWHKIAIKVIHFAMSYRPTKGCISYCLPYLRSFRRRGQLNRRILPLTTTTLSFDAPAKRNSCEYPYKPYISRN